jgi:hypothetical protein
LIFILLSMGEFINTSEAMPISSSPLGIKISPLLEFRKGI